MKPNEIRIALRLETNCLQFICRKFRKVFLLRALGAKATCQISNSLSMRMGFDFTQLPNCKLSTWSKRTTKTWDPTWEQSENLKWRFFTEDSWKLFNWSTLKHSSSNKTLGVLLGRACVRTMKKMWNQFTGKLIATPQTTLDDSIVEPFN